MDIALAPGELASGYMASLPPMMQKFEKKYNEVLQNSG